MAVTNSIGVPLQGDYLFRPVSLSGEVVIAPLDSAAAQSRLSTYIQQLPEVFGNRRITLHGLKNGCAISLAMSGTDLHPRLQPRRLENHKYSMSLPSDGASSKVWGRRRLVIRITFGAGGTLSQTKRTNGLHAISRFF